MTTKMIPPIPKKNIADIACIFVYTLLSLIEWLSPLGWTYPQMIILSMMTWFYFRLSYKMKLLSDKIQKITPEEES